MNFNTHSGLAGKHAFLSPSNYHWLNYDENKLEARFHAAMAARRGTELHDLAHEAIRLNIKFAKSHQALSKYVNDGVTYKMNCEQPLYYSDNCFGTADTLSFRRDKLRIHDLKTGVGKTSFKQLEVYAALFCLEYGVDPASIDIETRIYQREHVKVYIPIPEGIWTIMDKIVEADAIVEELKESE